MIPLNIWQTWHEKKPPPLMEACIETLKAQHPDFSHALYTVDDCRVFIKTHFDTSVLEAYNTLLPYSYKSDLWRLCVLYIHGGIYLDSKFQCVGDFRLNQLLDKEYYAVDPIDNDIAGGILVCKSGNRQLMRAIKEIVHNVTLRFYGKNPYDITGPTLLYRVMDISCNLTFSDPFSFFKDNVKILTPYSSYFLENRNYEHYTVAWNENRVYRQKILMLVAHPDDEILFGYNDIMDSSDVTIVCFTNAHNPIRSAEFFSVIDALGVKGIMLDYNDSMEDDWASISDSQFFEKIPFDNQTTIVSHNEDGEYGNIQHMRVHSIAQAFAKKHALAYRNFQTIKNTSFRESLLDLYISQKNIVNIYRHPYPLIKIHTKHWKSKK